MHLQKLNEKDKDRLITWGLFSVVFLFQAILTLPMEYPIITDEYSTLANGAFLSGRYDWSTAYHSSYPENSVCYYGYGMSLLYIPLFWLTNGIYAGEFVYHCALIVNSALMALVPVFAYRILRNILNREDVVLCTFISACVGLFSANSILSKYVFNDVMIIFISWVLLYILLKACCDKTPTFCAKLFRGGALIGFLCTYAYSVHGRGLVYFVVAAIIWVSYAWQKKSEPFSLLAFLGTAFLFMFADGLVKDYIVSDLLKVGGESAINTTSSFFTSRWISHMFTRGIPVILRNAVSVLFYNSFISFGISIILLVVVCCTVRNILRRDEINPGESYLYLYSAFLLLGLVAVTSIYSVNNLITEEVFRGEYYMYGRYSETSGSIAVFAGLYYLCFSKQPKKKVFIVAGTVFALLLLWWLFVTAPDLETKNKSSISFSMVSSIIAWGGQNFIEKFTEKNTYQIALCSVIIPMHLVVFYRQKGRKLFVILLTGLFCFSSLSTISNYLYKHTTQHKNDAVKAQAYFAEADIPDIADHVYFLDSSTRVIRHQLALPQYDVCSLWVGGEPYLDVSQVKENSYIVSLSDDDLDLKIQGLRRVDTSAYPDHKGYLYAYGDVLCNELEWRGQLLPISEAMEFDIPYDDGKERTYWKLNAGTLYDGTYCFTITGEYASMCEYTLYDADTTCIIPYDKALVSPGTLNQTVEIRFSIPSIMKRIVLEAEAPNEIICLTSAKLELSAKSLSEIEDSYYRRRNITVKDYNRPFIFINEHVVEGQTALIMEPGGEIWLQDVSLQASEYWLPVVADLEKNADPLTLYIEKEDGTILVKSGGEKPVEKVEFTASYLVEIPEKTDSAVIRFVNETDSNIVFRKMYLDCLR